MGALGLYILRSGTDQNRIIKSFFAKITNQSIKSVFGIPKLEMSSSLFREASFCKIFPCHCTFCTDQIGNKMIEAFDRLWAGAWCFFDLAHRHSSIVIPQLSARSSTVWTNQSLLMHHKLENISTIVQPSNKTCFVDVDGEAWCRFFVKHKPLKRPPPADLRRTLCRQHRRCWPSTYIFNNIAGTAIVFLYSLSDITNWNLFMGNTMMHTHNCIFSTRRSYPLSRW